MARRKLIRTDQYPYHVYARANNKEWFYLEQKHTWDIFSGLIDRVKIEYKADISIAVLMNNHFHILIQTPDANIDKIMQFFMKRMADKINKKAKRVNHVFGGPYKWTLITNTNYLYNVFRYIYQNPIRAGITANIKDYPFLKIYHLDQFPKNINYLELTNWLNKLPSEQANLFIHNALKRREFKPGRDVKTRRPFKFDTPRDKR